MEANKLKIKQFIRPFERRLAFKELRALTKSSIIPVDGDFDSAQTFSVEGPPDLRVLRSSLAYWSAVGNAPEGLTTQIRREATSVIARNGGSIEALTDAVNAEVPESLPTNRCLRYATHGVHEYRGKFFPQLVRALMNIAGLTSDSLVVDPMCGSGTTLVEARLSGRPCHGFDLNPLSVYLANVKCAALTLNAHQLIDAYQKLEESLSQPVQQISPKPERFSEDDQSYLARWFHHQVLNELGTIRHTINSLENAIVRDFYLVALSNILREVSYQKIDDLRIRRELTETVEGQTVKAFLQEALRSAKLVTAHLLDQGPIAKGGHTVTQGDARRLNETAPELVGRVDAIVTSPPYATALPYIDTDRLSLIYLRLLPRSGHRTLDVEMIGNREVSVGARRRYWQVYTSSKELLPRETSELIDLIDELNRNADVGFRRLNLAALLSKYFLDMRQTISQMHSLLKPDGTASIVIGNNRTIAGGRALQIDTSSHLRRISESIGFSVVENMPMEMLVSRDIFRKNAVPSEHILVLKKR